MATNPTWTASTAYSAGAVLIDPRGNVQQCTTAGTSGTALPAFAAAIAGTTADGSAVWTCRAVLHVASSYAMPSDMVASYPARDLVQLTNEDPTVTTVNASFLQTFLDQAARMIDSFIESRFSLPLKTVPEPLRIMCLDMAMYRMQSLRPLHDIEDARKRYDDALKMLRAIADGKLTLGLDAAGAEPPVAVPTVITSTADPMLSHVFDRNTMRGM
jgi:phage gp36-like protein